MGKFDRQIETAKRLILKNGQKVIWRQPAKSTDIEKPWNETALNPPTDFVDVPICFLPFSRINHELLRHLIGTEIPVGNLYGLMGAVSFDPTLKDVVIREGVEYRIASIDTLSPNGQKILHTVNFAA